MSNVNELIRKRLRDHPPAIQRICEEIISFARHLPPKALEARLEELIRKSVKRGEDVKHGEDGK